METLKRIQERALRDSSVELIDSFRAKNKKYQTKDRWNGSDGVDDQDRIEAAQDAVMKIVSNIDQTAI